jgi:TRAP transporter TAXI family solute receptor
MALATGLWPQLGRAELTFVSVGSGASTGVYYGVAKVLCGLVNRHQSETGVWCSPEATPGSVYNMDRLKSGELDFAIVQSDVQYYAFAGRHPWSGDALGKLRSVLSLHPELMTIIARAEAGIHDLDGLKARRLNVGSVGSGTRATWDALQGNLDWGQGTGLSKGSLKPDATTHLLCNGEIDANVLLVGHPSSVVETQLTNCRAVLVPVEGPQVDRFLAKHPYYQRGSIAASQYGAERAVATFGVKATLVTTTDVEDKVVYALAKAVMVNFEQFKNASPALKGLEVGGMMRDALTAPLHPGAQRVLQEPKLGRGPSIQP